VTRFIYGNDWREMNLPILQLEQPPNPSLNADVPCAGAAPVAADRRLASIRWA
jgi:hypothetical protein